MNTVKSDQIACLWFREICSNKALSNIQIEQLVGK